MEIKREYRDWIEYGKMYDRITASGNRVQLFNRGDVFACLLNCGLTETYEDNSSIVDMHAVVPKWFATPLEAMKYTFFEAFLGVNSTELQLDLPDELIDEIFRVADEKGLTMDEVVEDMLREVLFNREEECDCNQTCTDCGCH